MENDIEHWTAEAKRHHQAAGTEQPLVVASLNNLGRDLIIVNFLYPSARCSLVLSKVATAAPFRLGFGLLSPLVDESEHPDLDR